MSVYLVEVKHSYLCDYSPTYVVEAQSMQEACESAIRKHSELEHKDASEYECSKAELTEYRRCIGKTESEIEG